MNFTDWTSNRTGRLGYCYDGFASAKSCFFKQWIAFASERGIAMPNDLSGSCRYGSLFMQSVFGGSIRGHYQHQYNLIDGRLVDLSHDAKDVGGMANPYFHEPRYFEIPELQSSLAACTPRAERWANEFIAMYQTAVRAGGIEAGRPNEKPIKPT
ncbi:transcriptional regulator [Methylococcus mesophilus]|uniref:transcriptional regulator n=1 Tax=Methylococcus mesophilus TaxID=2993564 RepID=UPI00224A8A72|nr:transcriptional regulator [Methylococcus mesophilus]UZR29823.1 transcriptional regulator [Methylococcus mesophilus]